MSGAAHLSITGWGATLIARRLLDRLGVASGDWAALRSVPVSALTATARAVHLELGDLFDGDPAIALPWAPVVDGGILPSPAIDAVRDGAAAGIDLLVGSCADGHRLFHYGIPSQVPMPEPDVARSLGGSAQTRV